MVSGMDSNTNSNSNSLNVDSNTIPSPQSVGREFVRQYYTILNRGPQLLHRFYSDDSSFVHGALDKPGEVSIPVYGQENINKKILSLNFKDCHAKIRQVDSMETIGKGVVIQVTGELSNDRQPMRKFLQTFVLAPQSSTKYYAKNDIFRYQDEIFLDDDDFSEVEKTPDIEKTELPPLKSVDREEKEVCEDTVANVGPEYYENTNGSVHEVIGSNVEKLSISNEVSDEKSTELNSSDNFENETYLKNDDFDRNSSSPQPQTNEMKTYANMVSKNPNSNFPPFAGITTFTTAAKPETNPVSASFTRPIESSPIPSMVAVNNTVSTSAIAVKPPPNNSGPPKESRGVRRDRQYNNRRNDSNPRESTPGRHPPNDSDDDYRDKKQYPDENQVFVGNLPQNIVEDNLRDLFARYGKILDVRINRQNQKLGSNIKTPNYGFVTFENPDIVQQILKQKPIYFDNHRFNVEEKRSQTARGSFGSNRGNMGSNRPQMGSSGNQRRNQFSGNSGPRGGGGPGGGSGFNQNRNSSMRQNR